MSVMAPKNLWELRAMLDFSMDYNRPLAIRYRGEAYRGPEGFQGTHCLRQGEMLYEEEGSPFWRGKHGQHRRAHPAEAEGGGY